MNEHESINDLGEVRLIQIIENLVLQKSGKELLRDDAFFFKLQKDHSNGDIVFNSDMFVATTDAPKQMRFYQMGRKAVLMNISDLVVKGVRPTGIIISLGLPYSMKLDSFKELLEGIIDYGKEWDLDYIGGDLNQTKEIIINPTIFGFQKKENIIFRKGIEVGDFLVANGKFGLTGVGFDIILNRKGLLEEFPLFKRSIMSVLEPSINKNTAFKLAKNRLASSSIDSSDGLVKSLKDLMLANQGIGFEIDFNEALIDPEAIQYSKVYNISLEKLIFEGGEEFIHLFTLCPSNYQIARNIPELNKGRFFKIGRVISDEKLYLLKDEERKDISSHGFEHFK